MGSKTQADNQSPRPIEVLCESVPPLEIGRKYVQEELCSTVTSQEAAQEIEEYVVSLDEDALWRHVKAESLTKRLKWGFWVLGSEQNTWNEERWRIEDLRLSSMHPEVDRITKSEEIGRNPVVFKEYLDEYFTSDTAATDPLLETFRPQWQPVQSPVVLARIKEGQARIVEGSHRLIEMLFQGYEEATIYRGVRGGENDVYRMGEDTFLLLRQAHIAAQNDEERGAIASTLKYLVEHSTDGANVVQTYWVNRLGDDYVETRQAGEDVLKELKERKST